MHLAEEDLQMFTNFDEYMGEKDLNQKVSIIQQHSLKEYFDFYYSSEKDHRPGDM